MIEIKTNQNQLGIFDAPSFLEEKKRNKIIEFMEQNNFFVLLLQTEYCKSSKCSNCDGIYCAGIKKSSVIIQNEKKYNYAYSAIAFVVNREGIINYKDHFHRSISYVDNNFIPIKKFVNECEKIFQNKEEIVTLIKNIHKEYRDVRIICMKKVLVRERFREKII